MLNQRITSLQKLQIHKTMKLFEYFVSLKLYFIVNSCSYKKLIYSLLFSLLLIWTSLLHKILNFFSLFLFELTVRKWVEEKNQLRKNG